jgi:hypothetical protein
MDMEPLLSNVPLVDRMVVRNVLYAAWALQDTDIDQIPWNVENKDWGYIITLSFSESFSISLKDLELIKDLNPLRIEHIMLRNADKPQIGDTVFGAVLVIKFLNQDQPVTFTELEVVRVRKKHRGWFGNV